MTASKKRTNTAIRLIRKQTRGFRVGEWLYLFGCRVDGELVYGSFYINEIKKHNESTRTFLCRGAPGASSKTWAVMEFPSTYELHRIAGEPLGCIIREEEFA